MRGRPFGLLLAAAVMLLPASATAAPVLVMGHGGRVRKGNDPFLAAGASTPIPDRGAGQPGPRRAPAPAHRGAAAARAPAGKRRKPAAPTVTSELTRLHRAGLLDDADYTRYGASWTAAATAARHLRGTRAAELNAVMANLQGMAAARALDPPRLPILFLTLDRNRQWWTSGPVPFSGQEIEFTGSHLVWEYYPGQGLELQVLATFGKADGLYTAGQSEYPQMRALMDEMVPLAVPRAGGLAWEYYFHFDGGAPPWTSAMAQGTAIEALTRASEAFGPAAGPAGSPDTYIGVARRALPLFTAPPPLGVAQATPAGARYLQYSFAPQTDIINAFLQALIGLYDYGRLTGNQEAQRLFAAGSAQAQAELPRYDTGAWSLYQAGVEDSLDYHVLVTGFLDQLCARTHVSAYCTTAQHFHAYMKTPPVVGQVTTQAPGRRGFSLRFSLSKYSHVGITITRDSYTVLSTSAYFSHGVGAFAVPPLAPGTYQVVLAATDLPGNFTRIVGTLRVSRLRRST